MPLKIEECTTVLRPLAIIIIDRVPGTYNSYICYIISINKGL
jgi:hypothetical protein